MYDKVFILNNGLPTFITPEMAEEMVKHIFTDNRNKKPGPIDRYARDMGTGHFLLSDSCICQNENGEIINGQNRLYACIKSGKGFSAFIAVNMPNACIKVMDQPVLRPLHDILKISGVRDADSSLGSLINSLISRGDTVAHEKLTNQEFTDFFFLHHEAIAFSASLFKKREQGVGRAGVRAAVARAYYHVDHDRLTDFVLHINGAKLEMVPRNSAAMIFRDWVKPISRDDNVKRLQIHPRTERAIQAFVKGEVIENLWGLQPVKDELYPIPGEKEFDLRYPSGKPASPPSKNCGANANVTA